MTTLIAAVNQISLGLASVTLGVSAYSLPADLSLGPNALGPSPVAVINEITGELHQSLTFDLNPAPELKPKAPVVAAKTVVKTSVAPPESPYEALFAKYGAQFGVDPLVLKKIAWCESHYNFDSVGGNGAYGGMFQFSASTWASTRNAMGTDPNPELRFDPEQAIMTAAFKIAAGGIRAWPVCSNR